MRSLLLLLSIAFCLSITGCAASTSDAAAQDEAAAPAAEEAGDDQAEAAACSCSKGKAGESVWCDGCNSGYHAGAKVACKGCWEKKANGGPDCAGCAKTGH